MCSVNPAPEGDVYFPEWTENIGLTPQEYRLYFHVCRVLQRDGVFIERIEDTAKHCKMSAKAAQSAFYTLKLLLHSIGEYPKGSF